VPVLWYQLEPDDADVATLFYHLRAAGQRTRGGGPQPPIPLFTREFQPGLRSFARQFFQRLYGRLPPRFVLVFDDYHEVPEKSALHDIVGLAATELPPGSRLFILSRAYPPASLARLRSGKAIELVEWSDLQLSLREATAIARRGRGPRLPARAIRALHRETDGWVAGLVLGLEGGAVEEAGATRARSREAVFDYFAGEILRTESKRVQTVLLETAFVSPMSASFAEALTGSAEARRVLERLSRRNYFTQRYLEHELVYRYHPLFRDFLLARAEATFSPKRLMALRRHAARLLQDHHRAQDAVDLLRDAQAWGELASLIRTEAPPLVSHGRTATLDDWLNQVPDHVVASNGWLLHWRGMTHLPSNLVASRGHFERAFRLFDEGHDALGMGHAWCGIVESILYEWKDFALLDPWLARLDSVVERTAALNDRDLDARLAFTVFGALMFRRPQDRRMDAWTERALALALETDNISQRVMACSHLVHYQFWKGDHRRGQEIIDRVSRSPQLRDAAPLTRINWKLTEAINHWHHAEPDACLAAVAAGLREAEATDVHLWNCLLHAQAVYATLSAGRFAEGRAFLQQMGSALQGTRALDVSHYHYLAAWESLLRRDLPGARQHAETALTLAHQSGTPFPEGLASIAVADIAWELQETEKAQRHLNRARQIARAMNSSELQFLVSLTDARFAFDAEHEATGIRSLRAALVLGRERGYVNMPWWRAPMMAALCVKALEAGIEVEYVRTLVRKRDLAPDAPPLEIEEWPWPIKVYTLREFQLERDGSPVRFPRKVQQRPLDLLKALVAFGGREVPAHQITDALWPDADADTSRQTLEITLHRLRHLLGRDHAVALHAGILSLDPRVCWVDTRAFEHGLDTAAAAVRAGDIPAAVRFAERARELYRAPFLACVGEAPWALRLRERLRNRLLRALETLAHQYEALGRAEAAVESYERVLEIEDLAEEFYQQLMKCHVRHGQRADALAVYQRCCRALAGHGLTPSATTEAIRAAISG
jgi:DNA-binding SARP family transcriptional activator